MNKKIDKKRILLALIFVIVFLSVILLSCRTNVGFVNDRIYYKMSYSNLKFFMGKPTDANFYDYHIYCTYDNVIYNELEGKASFDFYNNKLINVNFSSKNCNTNKAKLTANYIKTFYKNKKGYYEKIDSDEDCNYEISFGFSDGAKGIDVSVKCLNNYLNIHGILSE